MKAVFVHTLLWMLMCVSQINIEWTLSTQFDSRINMAEKLFGGAALINENKTVPCLGTWDCLNIICESFKNKVTIYPVDACGDVFEKAQSVETLNKTIIAFSMLIALALIFQVLFELAIFATKSYEVFVASWISFCFIIIFSITRAILINSFIQNYNQRLGDKMPEISLGTHIATSLVMFVVGFGEHMLVRSSFKDGE